MKHNNNGTSSGLLLLAMLGMSGCSATEEAQSLCPDGWKESVWAVELRSPSTEYSITGELQFAGEGHFSGTGVSREGAREPMDYALDQAFVRTDSIQVQFAPSAISIRGRCGGTDTIAVTFSSHDGAIEGAGRLIKKP